MADRNTTILASKHIKLYNSMSGRNDSTQALMDEHPLQPVRHPQLFFFRHKVLSCYRRLMLCVLLLNLIMFGLVGFGVTHSWAPFTISTLATATGINLTISVTMRHEHYINLVYKSVVIIPQSTPIRVRRALAKLTYCQGGVHAGCGVSAVVWYLAYVIRIHQTTGMPSQFVCALDGLSITTSLLLWIIVVSSFPSFRRHYHDLWEMTHRYGGYVTFILIWTQTILSAILNRSESIGVTLLKTPNFWLLIVVSCMIIHPWLYLRRIRVSATPLSKHATRLWFGHRRMPPGRARRLAFNPLFDNHGFATIPNPNQELGYSIVVSSAGDFTRKLISDPPKHVWAKGAPTTGVIRIMTLFKPIVVVATGSGIGPCLSFMHAYPRYPLRIVWSARSPAETYQADIMSSVLCADPNAIVIDTKRSGQPDLQRLTWAVYKTTRAEAVVVISNAKLTADVVYAMEARGVAAFGAIFDS